VVGWKRLLVTGLCLAAWRALEQIVVPGINTNSIAARLQFLDSSSVLHAIGSGIPLASSSIVVMGIAPYINALVLMTVLRGISGRLNAIGETDDGRLRLERWTRALAAALALGQAYGWTELMQSGGAFPSPIDWFPRLMITLVLTGGTMLLVLLADVIDEFGLGFGNGAILIYALTPVALQVHRLAAIFASAPSVEALYRPFGVWLVFSIGVVAATVGVLLAVRRVPRVEGRKTTGVVEMPLVMSGVLRPPMFANAVLFIPVILGNYYASSNPGAPAWIFNYLTAFGPNAWTDVAYAAIDAGLVIGFTYFVVAVDFRHTRFAKEIVAHMSRLTLIAGTFLAVAVVVLPILEWHASDFAGRAIPMSGFNAVLVAAIILAIVGSLERSGKIGTRVPVPMSRLP